MSIQVGLIQNCFICGFVREEWDKEEHVCYWEKNYSAEVNRAIRDLIADAYCRGRKDAQKGLTLEQRLLLENAISSLDYTRKKLHEINPPPRPTDGQGE